MANGIVLYTDGGADQSTGVAGWGIHGYIFKAEYPKKGSGNSDVHLTHRGYTPREKGTELVKGKEYTEQEFLKAIRSADSEPLLVTPISYVDGNGAFCRPASNNVAELTATLRGLETAFEHDVQYVHINTDSTYVQNGLTKWIKSWIRNNWVKPDMQPVANKDLWLRLIAAKERLEQRGTKVSIEWVRGHNGDHGNELADEAATIGVIISRNLHRSRAESDYNSITTESAEGYWKRETSRHPFMNLRWIYFNTCMTHCRPGEYYMGSSGEPGEMTGTRTSDGAFAYIRVAGHDPIIEMMRGYQTELADGNLGIATMDLDTLFQFDNYTQLERHGKMATFIPKGFTRNIDIGKKKPLCYDYNPPMLIHRAVDAVTNMETMLEGFLRGREELTVTDITADLYETTVKPQKKGEDKILMKLRPEFKVGMASNPFNLNYRDTDGVLRNIPVTLTFGIDILDRNGLKRIEEDNPTVYAITWVESTGVFRYATIIKVGEDIGIWCAYYSNIRVVNPELNK